MVEGVLTGQGPLVPGSLLARSDDGYTDLRDVNVMMVDSLVEASSRDRRAARERRLVQ